MVERHVHYDRRFGAVYPLFQLLGFSLVPLHGQAPTSLYILTVVFVSLYVACEIIVMVYSLTTPEAVFFLSDATGTFADAIQFVIPLAVPLVSLLLSLGKRTTQKRITVLMDRIDKLFESHGTAPGCLERFNYQLGQAILTTMLVYNVIPAVNEFFIISRISANRIWYRNWYLKVLFFVLIRLGDSFFLLHVHYLRNRYRFLNNELQLTVSTKVRNVSADAIHRRLVHMKVIQNLLKDLTGEVSDRFGWQLFGVITMLFICTTIDGYWMYASLHHDGNLYKVESFLCAISPLLMFFVLFTTCQRCLDEGEMTFYHLHSVYNHALPHKTIVLIEGFSKQLHNERINFSAANFFDLRLSALTTLISRMVVILIFQLCGLQTYAGPSAPFGSTLALLWCIGNCILYAGVLAYCFIERRWLFTDSRTGTGINVIPFIKSSITIVAHLVVLLEAILARGVYRALDIRVTSVDGTLDSLTNRQAGSILAQARTQFRNKLLLFGAFCGAIELGILVLVYTNPVHRVIWCLTVPSLVTIRMKHLHHAYHIDRLTARFGVLREQLESLVIGQTISPGQPQLTGDKVPPKLTSLNRWKMNSTLRPAIIDPWTLRNPAGLAKSPGPDAAFDAKHLRQLFATKSTYLTLWHAAKDLNGCCVYSQLANLLQNFIQCTCDLYTLYSLLYLNQLGDIFGFILSIVATFTALGIVLAACENCKNQVGQMGQLLYKRRGDETDLLAKMVENFSLLLQHTPIYFSLGGFFDMDFMLLKEIAAAITTYMVIFIQFMPKVEPGTDGTIGTLGNVSLANNTLNLKSE
uniref:Gustatory receptor n=1 Tax=Anopheles culicifacies TaxID=139723 RepID=A0A182MSG3_9DIPT